jgi:hypothetical protein
MSQRKPTVSALPLTSLSKENEKAPSFLVPIFKLPVFLYRFTLAGY